LFPSFAICIHFTLTDINTPPLFSTAGYYTFEECGGLANPNPTLGLKVGETYTFIQKDISNWMHPLGFAYFPDGAHDDQIELEPTINTSLSICPTSFSCPSPQYFLNDIYLGENGTSNFGLDDYEPKFTRSLVDWTNFGTFSVQLNFDDMTYQNDIFYFCHVSFSIV
jgi:hypothetical protein